VGHEQTYDVAVVGAGVFGAWATLHLSRAGALVALIDAYGPANSRASSGGESRLMRLGYGRDEIYTRSAQRSLKLWQDFFSGPDQKPELASLFQQTGVLWLAHETDPYCEATLVTLQSVGVPYQRLDRDDIALRFPQLELGPIAWGILEPFSGVIMGRRAVQAVVSAARTLGVTYVRDAFSAPTDGGQLTSITTQSGREIRARNFVFACGPWLPKLFPHLLGELIQVTRQEVFFFGPPPGNDSFSKDGLPPWIDFNDFAYAIPDLEQRGFKIAIDAHGPEFDPDNGERVTSARGLTAVRAYLAKRLPRMADAPVTETRVCQYENTSNGDFLIDRHPDFDNLWLVGGGSGHGFKHGPAIGEYVARLLSREGRIEPRYTLVNKARVQQRTVY
jgi:glycine/D-amino acid oxidase-like deaminating enzyme